MIATIAIAALFAAATPAQENLEDLENQEIVFYEDDCEEEVALNEEVDEEEEYVDQLFFEDEGEISEELVADVE